MRANAHVCVCVWVCVFVPLCAYGCGRMWPAVGKTALVCCLVYTLRSMYVVYIHSSDISTCLVEVLSNSVILVRTAAPAARCTKVFCFRCAQRHRCPISSKVHTWYLVIFLTFFAHIHHINLCFVSCYVTKFCSRIQLKRCIIYRTELRKMK